MALIVKFLHGPEYPGCEDTAPSSIYADVVSIHFPEDNPTMALLWVREPVKTALVPGFCENEKHVCIGGPVYVMNESGRTVSVHRPPFQPRFKVGDIIPADKIGDPGGEKPIAGEIMNFMTDDGMWKGEVLKDGGVRLVELIRQ